MRVLITGSNRGIGLEYVRQLLARGDTVFAACRNPDLADDLKELQADYGDKLTLVQMDVSDENSIATAHTQVSQQTAALDILINNAAINPGREEFGGIKKSDLMQTFEVNVAGVMLVSQQFVDLLKNGEQPRLIQISSRGGSFALNARTGMCSYRTSKAALNMLNKVIHHELKLLGIISIVMAPGWVITDMGGPNASLQPKDSIRQQLAVIDSLTMDDAGTFKDYTGSTVAW